ncbi:MAG: hypothetical protein K8S55_08865 [Phycisphaerae bacterium]|nr:hypothetical protein [Phycisphaerae bacterium]
MKKNRNSIVLGVAVVVSMAAVALLGLPYVNAAAVNEDEVEAKKNKVDLNDYIDYEDGSVILKADRHKLGDEEEKCPYSVEEICGLFVTLRSLFLEPPKKPNGTYRYKFLEFPELIKINGVDVHTHVDIYQNIDGFPGVRIWDGETLIQVETSSLWDHAANFPLRAEGNLWAPGDGTTPHWSIKSTKFADVDLDADTDNNSVEAHRPPDESVSEDAKEDEVVGLLIGLNDDNDVDWDRRDCYHSMDRDKDDDILDMKLKIDITKVAFPIVGTTEYWIPLWCYDDQGHDCYNVVNPVFDYSVYTGDPPKNLHIESSIGDTSGTIGNMRVSFTATEPWNVCSWCDTVQFLLIGTDIDLDSNNDGSISNINDYNDGEDFFENHPVSELAGYPEYKFGMFVSVNEDDDDSNKKADNGWDGTDWDGADADTVQGNADKADMKLAKLRKLNLTEAQKIVLDNEGAFIMVTKVGGTGAVRVFCENGVLIGKFVDDTDGYATAGSKELFELISGNSDCDLRIEGLRPGEVILEIKLGLISGSTIHKDQVKITVLPRIERDIAGGAVDWKPIEDTSRKVLPGQKMNLRLSATSLDPNAKWEWTLPGVLFKNYTANQNAGILTKIYSEDRDDEQCGFYWADTKDSRNVSCKVEVNNVEVTVETFFVIEKPSCTYSSKLGTVAIDAAQTQMGLLPAGGSTMGIDYTAKVEMPAGYTAQGKWNYVQIIRTHWTQTRAADNVVEYIAQYGLTGLDTTYPYEPSPYTAHPGSAGSWNTGAATHTEGDTPYCVLAATYKRVEREDWFWTYVMFLPPGNESRYVPLQVISWDWKGSATKNLVTGIWALDAGSNQNASAATASSSHPTWAFNNGGLNLNENGPLGINMPTEVTEGDASAQATISVRDNVTANLTVNLASSDTSEIAVPVTVTIAAGTRSATFNITIVNDTVQDGTQTAIVTATAATYSSASGAVAVRDND